MGQLVLNYSATHNQIVIMNFLVLSAAQLVTYPNGAVVPADTAEVAAAKAAHFGAHGLPLAYAGYPYAHAGYPYAHAYAGYPYGLVGHANGAVVPVDEPAVLAAKAEHAAAGGAIHPVGALGYAYGHPYAGLVAHPNGAVVPAEPAELVAARAEHLAAHAAA